MTGGVGAIASLGAQAKKLSQLKKLGELAELLKKVPKAKGLTMRKQKEKEEKAQRKKEVRKNTTNKNLEGSKKVRGVTKEDSKLTKKNDLNTTNKNVFSGHGSYHPSDGELIVPSGGNVTVYSEHGGMITDDLGHAIETDGDLSKVYKKTYNSGDVMPNYTLHPADSDIEIKGNPITVDKPTTIDKLVKENQGDCHWAAYLAQDGTVASHKAFDLDGVIDYDKKEWITVY
jgi:hypothetical protein